MGASSWDYIVPFQDDIIEAMLELQRQVFAAGKFWKGYSNEFDTGSLEELLSMKDTQHFWEWGTHSILDMDRLIYPDEPDEEDTDGAITMFPDDETLRYLGSDRPSRQDFDRARDDLMMNADLPRWHGRYVILYDDGKPAEIAFFGYSGD
jgi:hypothetical protein